MSTSGVVLLSAAVLAALYLFYRLLEARREAALLRVIAERDRSLAETRARKDAEDIAALRDANDRLAPWAIVADAADRAGELLRSAREGVEAARIEAETIIAGARGTAATLIEEAKGSARVLAEESTRKSVDARIEAEGIVAAAYQRAQEIAGKALTALENAEEYDRTVKALRNIIEGYGDRYVVPGQNLLDELAEEVGYAEAGRQLKLVRDQVRVMVAGRKAATCDYVEANRKETAIRFVVDAFNGKADSIVARVKNNNIGTLQQEMRDGFTLVNHNGAAFRNARITREYLELRLEELRWAGVALEIRMKEREEQRRIKEQIREEEKAVREYERAIREASKEEELLREAMEKAELQMARASEEQRAQFEAQVAELAERLRAAEERNQRALSMAQQTKRGHVYVISNVGSLGENVYKIGLTRRLEPLDRIRELGDSSVPFEFDVHALLFAEDAPGLENRLHKHFVTAQVNKVNPRKEFFRVDLAHIRSEIEALGLTAQWTMTSNAREYRESLAIDRAISENPAAREAWLTRQLKFDVTAFPPEELESGTVGVASEVFPDEELLLAPNALP